MKTIFGMIPLLLLRAVFSFAQELDVPDKTKRRPTLTKISGTPRDQILNINNLTTWLRADGQSNHAPSGDNGAIFPRGTRWVIYQDGLVWGGKAYLDANLTQPSPLQLVRVGGQTYSVGTREGRIIGQGASARPADPAGPETRIYRIRRDYARMDYFELQRDAAEYFQTGSNFVSSAQVDQVRNQYAKDWQEWPVQFGAPYIERNGIPGYQPPPAFFWPEELITEKYDEPGIAGADPNFPADQVIWTVFNDLDRNVALSLYGSEPLGLEVQVTLWGYRRYDALGNIYFKKVRLLNKGGVDVGGGKKGSHWIESLFVGQWSDPDLGAFADDLVGCDTLLNMGYCYNGNKIDREFAALNLPVPAIGYDLLQGPIVAGTPTDVAIFDLRKIYGKKNLKMSAFAYFSSGAPIDPPTGYIWSLRYWRMLQGFAPVDVDGIFYPHPPGFTPSKFPLSGDPVTKTGFIDGLGTAYSFAPGDRRLMVSTGPTRFAPGDTQEVVVATVAGLGADHLSSLSVMKYNDRAAKQAFRSLFDLARPPASPRVRVIALDREIVLDWGSDLALVEATEQKIIGGEYAFEGYNVYQLPSSTAQLSEGVKLATFDVANGVWRIIDEVPNPTGELIVPTVVQNGNDSGIQRQYRISRDTFNENRRLHNGTEYYFAVTAYNYSSHPLAFPKALESLPQILKAKPQIPFGIDTPAQYNDTLRVTHAQGRSDGAVYPIVINPLAGTGDLYEVRFDTTGGTTAWFLRNASKDKIVLSRGRLNETYHAEGGIALHVTADTARGLKSWEWTAGVRFLTWTGGADGLQLEGFNGAAGWDSPQRRFGNGSMAVPADRLKTVEIRFAPTSDNLGRFDPADPNVSYAYRYGRSFSGSPANPAFAPFIINVAPGYSYQDYTPAMPLAVYDLDANPPRRLAVGFLENNVVGGSVDGRYWPPLFSSADNVSSSGPREWLFIFDGNYTGSTPDPTLQKEMLATPLPVMYMATWARRNDGPWPLDNKMRLDPVRINTVADIFTYTAPAPDTSLQAKKAGAKRVGVFPNPYYAGHSQEKTASRRFVTFNNLPPKAKIRIFNLGGQLVRILEKDNSAQFLEWDLTNTHHWQVASGMYLCHVEMPEINETKILKLAVVQAQFVPPR
jgi:hypothetical protein